MKINPANLEWKQAHDLFFTSIVPRPIALVSTIGGKGVFNVAPFGTLAGMCVKPMLLGISIGTKRDGQKKDTLVNIEFSKDFVINVVTETLAEAMNQSSQSYPSYVSEFNEVGLTPVKADIVKAPMVGESPINMECRLVQILEFGSAPRLTSYIIGEVVQVHIKDGFFIDGKIKQPKLMAIAGMGGDLYCRTRDTFEMKRPETIA